MTMKTNKDNGFHDFLISLGFNHKGAEEVEARIKENRADIDDLNLHTRYTKKTMCTM